MKLPTSVRLSNGDPAYPVFEISHPTCNARVALHGAHVMSWKPADEEEVLYLSPDAIYREGKAIRGGIPVCWPWFNAHPAQVFMGDVGALALGGMLGTMAIFVRQEIVLFIMGGVFVAETVSVMVQVFWFKYTKRKYGEGRRVLRMAPLHHHFEVGGWKETQVVIRFWIISMMLVLIGLSSLKIR